MVLTSMTCSLAMAELYIAIATIFSSFEFELFETDDSDVEMAHAYLVPYTKWESKGIRVKVTKVLPGYETAIAAIKG